MKIRPMRKGETAWAYLNEVVFLFLLSQQRKRHSKNRRPMPTDPEHQRQLMIWYMMKPGLRMTEISPIRFDEIKPIHQTDASDNSEFTI